ncbi:MAG: class I SAM-dependent methyltransferase [Patescibacteria group bacterium]|nr:class I SAM-dependent methyltransferase [Patescibacteria group bacterium]
MFFPQKIQKIKPGDKVLEIGPGGTPFTRSDVFLELRYKNQKEAKFQRGNTKKLKTNKPVVYYDGGRFPFLDKEFDYVICSHVLEHVEDVGLFLLELFRIARKGYIEYPTVYYEYLYNFSVHLNLLKFNKGQLIYLKKTDTPLCQFSSIHKLYYQTLKQGYSSFIDDLRDYMFEGFEWLSPFAIKKASSLEELTWKRLEIPVYKNRSQKRILKLVEILKQATDIGGKKN